MRLIIFFFFLEDAFELRQFFFCPTLLITLNIGLFKSAIVSLSLKNVFLNITYGIRNAERMRNRKLAFDLFTVHTLISGVANYPENSVLAACFIRFRNAKVDRQKIRFPLPFRSFAVSNRRISCAYKHFIPPLVFRLSF